MKNHRLALLLGLTLCLLLVPPDRAFAKDADRGEHGKGKAKPAPGHVHKAEHAKHSGRKDASGAREHTDWHREWGASEFLAAGFSSAALRELLDHDRRLLDIGAKPLPPGIQKNLVRGKPLPPGIAKQRPAGVLAQRLPRVEGHDWLVVGRNLVLVTVGTLLVREILHDVFH